MKKPDLHPCPHCAVLDCLIAHRDEHDTTINEAIVGLTKVMGDLIAGIGNDDWRAKILEDVLDRLPNAVAELRAERLAKGIADHTETPTTH